MEVCPQNLPGIARYIERCEDLSHHSIHAYDQMFAHYLRYIMLGLNRLDNSTNILEIGIGIGWFPILCKMRGLRCEGIDISPQLVDHARAWGRELGVEPDVEIGNIETADLGECRFDAIVAADVFEHVEKWKAGLVAAHRALKSNGVFYFESTNKYSVHSDEYALPFYSWLPNRVRYGLRIVFDDPQIMKNGIDFNQFRHSQLRREFERIGFSTILDRVEMSQTDLVSSNFRRNMVSFARKMPWLKSGLLTFCDATRFLCIK